MKIIYVLTTLPITDCIGTCRDSPLLNRMRPKVVPDHVELVKRFLRDPPLTSPRTLEFKCLFYG